MKWPRVDAILALTSELGGKVYRMLDLGCSDGSLTLKIKEACQAKEVYGIDIDENKLRIARQRGIKTFRVDLNNEKLPFEEEYFDLVTACALLEHLHNPDNLIKESYRVLKRDGFLLLHTRNLANWANRILLLLGFQPYGVRSSSRIEGLGLIFRQRPLSVPSNYCAFTLKALLEFLDYYNFRPLKMIGTPGVYPENPLIRFIDRLMALRPSLARNIILLCSKK